MRRFAYCHHAVCRIKPENMLHNNWKRPNNNPTDTVFSTVLTRFWERVAIDLKDCIS